MPWTEAEIKSAIQGYFDVLRAEEKGEKVNKTALYKSLHKKHPHRTAKAFELKFQNISAVLYENKMPYCSGLKPKSNYQRLLKIMVLDHLDRSPVPTAKPHEILFRKLRELHDGGAIKVEGTGSGRYGLAIEKALGIPPNSSKEADFMGIELKTKVSGGLQTLFSRTPSRYLNEAGKRGFFDACAYYDENRNRNALFTSMSCKPCSLGFSLCLRDQKVVVQFKSEAVMEYDAERLEEALFSKHSQTVFIRLEKVGRRQCVVARATYCKWPSIIQFLKMLKGGKVFLDLTLAERPSGAINDHGFLWRVPDEAVADLYLHNESLTLNRSP